MCLTWTSEYIMHVLSESDTHVTSFSFLCNFNSEPLLLNILVNMRQSLGKLHYKMIFCKIYKKIQFQFSTSTFHI